MKMRFGLGVVAATLFIGCDDEATNGPDAVDSVDASETTPDGEIAPDVDEDVGEVEPIELVGTWTTEFGEETISETRWDGFCLQAIARVGNEENVAILETVGGEGCGAGFSRVIWHEIVADAFDYCTTTYGATTAEEAATAPTSAISEDLMTGCGGFPWSHLTKKK